MTDIAIVAAVRTPVGSFRGRLRPSFRRRPRRRGGTQPA